MTDPGIFFIVAHCLLAVATGGLGLIVSIISLALATAFKLAQELNIEQKINNTAIKKLLGNENMPIRMAGVGLIFLSVIAFHSEFYLLGFAFLLFCAGDFLYNTKFSRRFPLDNVCFTAAGCITTYLAGEDLLPMIILITGFILATYNILKPTGNRNFMRPKLWAGSAAGVAAILGFLSGQADQFYPSLAMVSVFYSYYICIEAKELKWVTPKKVQK